MMNQTIFMIDAKIAMNNDISETNHPGSREYPGIVPVFHR